MLFISSKNSYACESAPILIYPKYLGAGGFGDRASNLLMAIQLKKQCPDYKIDFLIDEREMKNGQFHQLLGFPPNEPLRFPFPVKISGTQFRKATSEEEPDFHLVQKSSSKYKFIYTFSSSSAQILQTPTPHLFFSEFGGAYSPATSVSESQTGLYPVKDETKSVLPKEIIELSEHERTQLFLKHLKQNFLNSSDNPLQKNERLEQTLTLTDPKIIFAYIHENETFKEYLHYLIKLLESLPKSQTYVLVYNDKTNQKNDAKIEYASRAETIQSIPLPKNLVLLPYKSLTFLESALGYLVSALPSGTTGDVSLSLALTYSKYLPIYELLAWKTDALLNLQNYSIPQLQYIDATHPSGISVLKHPTEKIVPHLNEKTFRSFTIFLEKITTELLKLKPKERTEEKIKTILKAEKCKPQMIPKFLN